MNWTDILLHTIAAILYVIIVPCVFQSAYAVLYRAFLVFGVFVWPIREIIQHYPNPIEIFTHMQSLLEWTIPSIIIFCGMEYLAYKINDSYRGL